MDKYDKLADKKWHGVIDLSGGDFDLLRRGVHQKKPLRGGAAWSDCAYFKQDDSNPKTLSVKLRLLLG